MDTILQPIQNMAVRRLLLYVDVYKIPRHRKITYVRRRRRTSNVRLPLELRSDRRETSATRVSEDLQISIF